MEIISGVERRRRWRIEDKLRILAEIDGGATLTDVARRYDVSRGLLWQWRDAQRRGADAAGDPVPDEPDRFRARVAAAGKAAVLGG